MTLNPLRVKYHFVTYRCMKSLTDRFLSILTQIVTLFFDKKTFFPYNIPIEDSLLRAVLCGFDPLFRKRYYIP